VDGGGDPGLVERTGDPVAAGSTLQDAVVNEGAHHLLDEEGIPTGALYDVGGQSGE
jgi:hypothetical protein